MATIPASQLVAVYPSVLSAGGSALDLNAIVLTQNTRVPVGQVLSFPNDGVSVGAFFGASATEVTVANIYFSGFETSTKKPGAVLFAQYNSTSVAAWLRGGSLASMSLATLQNLTGDLTVVIDGTARTATGLSFTAASSFSAAATLIQSGLNATPATLASVTGSIAAGTATVTGYIDGYILTVTGVTSGTLVPGATLSGTGVTSTKIAAQLTGTTGGVGTYAVDVSQTVAANSTITASYGTLTVTAVASGTLSVGQRLTATGITATTIITALGTGTGLAGTYIVDQNAVVASASITAVPVDCVVTYDSVSEAFYIQSGITGAASSIAYATGSLSGTLALTQATGATESQGAVAAQPGAFMTSLTQITQNWATFMHMFDPDGGVAGAHAQKLLFATWTTGENKRYAYVAADADITATESTNATSSFGNVLKTSAYDGTFVIYDPLGEHLDAFVCGIAASLDTAATNGRATFAFRGQAGLTASVTSATVASNLIANGYNFYGAYATANQSFIELQPGQVSGSFEWMDSYVNQIWLNNALQLALMELLQNVNSVPYNSSGYALIEAACADPIAAALNFGAIRAGVTLSTAQAAQINNAAGVANAANAVQLQGYYLQVKDATAQTRAARGTPPITLWYADGGAVQSIQLASILVQ